MRLGLIARADNTGLGNQTKMYFDWLKPYKTLVVDFTEINRQMGKKTKFYPDRFPRARISNGYPAKEDLEWLLDGADTVFTAETPYNHDLFAMAREKGVRSILHYNFEFLGNLQDNLPFPDLLLAPSMWRAEEVKRLAENNGIEWAYLPLGVNREELPFRLRTKAEMFVHIGGIPAHKDRNGTLTFLKALEYITAPMKVKVYAQTRLPRFRVSPQVELEIIENEIEDYKEFYGGDVLVFPRKYGGQTLILNEAMSSGMAVLMTDCGPQNEFLHPKSLLTCHDGGTIRAKAVIDVFETEPKIIAQSMDELARNPSLVKGISMHSDQLANLIDWRELGSKYHELFEPAYSLSTVLK